MPPKRTNTSALSDASSSTIPKRPRGRPRKDADVSLSSTVGGPTPARRSAAASSSSSSRRQAQDSGDVSLASTLAPSTPAQPKKRGRPAKSSLTTPAMRAFTSADTSAASSAGPKKRGRPPKPKSILSARDDRTLTSPDNSVSFSDDPAHRALLRGLANQRAVRDADTTAGSSVAPPRKRGRPPKSAGTATSDTSIDMSAAATPNAPARKRGRPPNLLPQQLMRPSRCPPMQHQKHQLAKEADLPNLYLLRLPTTRSRRQRLPPSAEVDHPAAAVPRRMRGRQLPTR